MRKKLVQFFKDGKIEEQKWFFTDDDYDYEIISDAKAYGKSKGYSTMNVLNGYAYEL